MWTNRDNQLAQPLGWQLSPVDGNWESLVAERFGDTFVSDLEAYGHIVQQAATGDDLYVRAMDALGQVIIPNLHESDMQLIRQFAADHSKTVVDLLTRYIKAGMVFSKMEHRADPGDEIIVKERGQERRVRLFDDDELYQRKRP